MLNNALEQEMLQVLRSLSEEQARLLVQVGKAMQPSGETRPEYDEANDPLVGFLDGPSTDLSIRAKEILREEIDPKSGWTNKDKPR
jgi:hypothetical protein